MHGGYPGTWARTLAEHGTVLLSCAGTAYPHPEYAGQCLCRNARGADCNCPYAAIRTSPRVRADRRRAQIGTADLVRHGDDVTVVAWGWMRHEAERACAVLAPDGINADLIDLVSIKPLDFETIVESVRRTGALLVVE